MTKQTQTPKRRATRPVVVETSKAKAAVTKPTTPAKLRKKGWR